MPGLLGTKFPKILVGVSGVSQSSFTHEIMTHQILLAVLTFLTASMLLTL